MHHLIPSLYTLLFAPSLPFLFTSLHSILLFPFHFFLPPFFLQTAHALLCEGIEFISEHWAGHTATSTLSLLAHTLKSSS